MALEKPNADVLLRLNPTKRNPLAPTVTGMVGATPCTVYRWIREGLFPAPIRIGARATRWRLSDVQAWIANHAAAATATHVGAA